MQNYGFATWLFRALPALLLALLPTWQSFAQEPSLKLLGVAVEGNTRADAGLIVASSGMLVGEQLTGDKIQAAIRQLWKLNLFSDIKILAERQTADGVYLLIRVSELPRVSEVKIEGGKKFGKDEVEEAVDMSPGRVIKPSDPVRLRRKLMELGEKKGYLLADIRIETKPTDDPGMVKLNVHIKEGKKVRIEDIYFEGNDTFSDKKLRRKLRDTHRKAFLRSGVFHRDKFEEDKKNLVDFYQENGFIDASVQDDSISYSEDRRRMLIFIKIEEGPRFYFGDVTFSGQDLFSDDELRRQLLFAPGEVFNQKLFDMTLQDRLMSLFYDRGYIKVFLDHTKIPVGGDTLDVHIHIIPGNSYAVRKINITGNTKTREKVIRREFALKPGDTFDVSKLKRSIREVAILNYFADVQPDVEDVSDDQVDLWVNVEERPTDQANLSAGYSERDGLIGAIGFAAPNLFGSGQRLSLDWNFGARYGSFSISYTEPWFLDTETLVGGSFYHVRRRWVDGFTEKLLGGSVSLGRRFRWPDDFFRGDWTYRVERSRYSELSSDMLNRVRAGTTQLDTLPRVSSSITQSFTRDSRDLPEFPSQGSVYRLTSEFAGGPFLGNDRFHKHIVSAEWFTQLRRKFVLFNMMQFGYLDPYTSNPRDIPLLEYFYMGGSGLTLGTPLRGYDERTVGESIPGSSTAQGGKSMFKTSAEFRLLLVDNPTIYVLGFTDAGNTWASFQHTDLFDLRRSVGFGIRLYMPMIGLIGLDYGYGMDPAASGRKPGWTPHFQFGRSF